jgi:hypothetical protein
VFSAGAAAKTFGRLEAQKVGSFPPDLDFFRPAFFLPAYAFFLISQNMPVP